MAFQVSDFKFLGELYGITGFINSDGQYCARKSSGVDGDKVRYDPAFERTRENMAEFRTATKALSLFWKAFREAIKKTSDRKRNSCLQGRFVNTIRTDRVRGRGHRRMEDCDLSPLLDFELNGTRPFEKTLPIPLASNIDRSTGILTVDIPPFIPANLIEPIANISHFQLTATAAEIDFIKGTYTTRSVSSAVVPIDSKDSISFTLENTLHGSTGHLFVVIGIQLFKKHRGKMWALKNHALNSALLVNVLAADQSRSVVTDPGYPEPKSNLSSATNGVTVCAPALVTLFTLTRNVLSVPSYEDYESRHIMHELEAVP